MILDCDSVWVRIVIAWKQPLHIGSSSKSTNSDSIHLARLNESLKKLNGKTTLPNIISVGDINIPDICWENNTISNNPQYFVNLNQSLLGMANNNMLRQLWYTPKTGDNMLNQIIATIADHISNNDTVPAMSDHDVMMVRLSTTVKCAHNKTCPLNLRRKGNMHGLGENMETFKDQ